MLSVLAIHVIDEALTGFLPFYNKLILDQRQKFGFFPMPTLTFDIWLGGILLLLCVAFALIPVVRRGGKFIRIVYTTIGILMVLNAGAHLIGSLYTGSLLPGFWSSPFLFITAVFVVIRGVIGRYWEYNSKDNIHPHHV